MTNMTTNGFTRAKVIAQTKDLSRKIRITFVSFQMSSNDLREGI